MPVMRKLTSLKALSILNSYSYSVFENGNATGSFMMNPDGSLYVGEVWPGYTVFPDWISGGAGQWWIDEMVNWHNKISFDGIWIDMSEVGTAYCLEKRASTINFLFRFLHSV